MVGMNVGLNTRVIDQIGLANPLAAHTARLEDARIGHDKNLFPDWAVAEGPFLAEPPYIPPKPVAERKEKKGDKKGKKRH
mgnify:CR=1 FL=1